MHPLVKDSGRVAVKAAVVWAVWHGLTWITDRQRSNA